MGKNSSSTLIDPNSQYINLNRLMDCTEAEGPGKRFCLWVQGCLRHCPGCCNQEMQELVPHIIISLDELCSSILRSRQVHLIEGITFLGGEPMLQAKSLWKVAKLCQQNDLSVIVFTGYTYNDLLVNDQGIENVSDLLKYTDVLIDGSYIESLRDNVRNWVGSTNQVFHYLTNRYDTSIEMDERYRNVIELEFNQNGVLVSGCPKSII